MAGGIAVDEDELDEPSQWLLHLLLGDPVLADAQLLMEPPSCYGRDEPPEPGLWSLVARFPSPTGRPELDVELWLEPGGTDVPRLIPEWQPTLSFAGWHTHSFGHDDDHLRRFFDVARCIFSGEIVAYCASENETEPDCWWIVDLADDDDVLNLLADPPHAGPIHTISWDGKRDCALTLDGLLAERELALAQAAAGQATGIRRVLRSLRPSRLRSRRVRDGDRG